MLLEFKIVILSGILFMSTYVENIPLIIFLNIRMFSGSDSEDI